MRITIDFEAGDSLLSLDELRRRVESAYMKGVVERFSSRGAAAMVLGISRKNLWERLRAYNLSHLVSGETEAEADALRHVASPFNVAA